MTMPLQCVHMRMRVSLFCLCVGGPREEMLFGGIAIGAGQTGRRGGEGGWFVSCCCRRFTSGERVIRENVYHGAVLKENIVHGDVKHMCEYILYCTQHAAPSKPTYIHTVSYYVEYKRGRCDAFI